MTFSCLQENREDVNTFVKVKEKISYINLSPLRRVFVKYN